MSRGPELSAAAFDEHLKQLKHNYGHQAIVNLLGSSLVGSKEGEATLSTAYQTHHKACDHHTDIPHILFDYHAEGAKHLSRLKNKLHKYSEKFGFFTKKGDDITRYYQYQFECIVLFVCSLPHLPAMTQICMVLCSSFLVLFPFSIQISPKKQSSLVVWAWAIDFKSHLSSESESSEQGLTC